MRGVMNRPCEATKHLRIEFNCFVAYVDVAMQYYPAERRTETYPGAPEQWVFCGAEVKRVIGEFYDLGRDDRPDWFEWLDERVDEIIENDKASFLD